MDSERTKRETMANSSNKESRPGQRQWKRTAFGANFQYKKHNQSFVLMSYNILSQDNLEKQPFLYREHIEYALAWNYRLRYLQREIESIRPTILCLQEVQVTHLPGIANALQRLNYDRPLFKQRNGGQSDGCAIFYNRSLFQLVDHHCIEFFQPQISILNRFNVAIVAKFTVRTQPKHAQTIEFCVCTTHLLYNPRRSDVRGAQTQILLAELDRFACHSVTKEPLPIILTGDFNSPPHSDIYRLIADGEVKKGYDTRQLPTILGITDFCQHHAVVAKDERKETSLFNSFDQPPIIDDSALDGVMTAQQKFYESRQFTDEMIRESGLPFTSQSISHHLNFTSAFIANGKATTFHDQWLTVDYVFYTKFKRKTPSNVRRTEPIGYSALQQIGYLELPSIAECVNTGPIPNPNLGSDHYSLAVEFVLLLSRVSH